MSGDGIKNRGKEVMDNLLDTGLNEVTNIGNDIIRLGFQELRTWIVSKIQEAKSNPDNDAQEELEKLQLYLDKTNELHNIGVKDGTIRMAFAMRQVMIKRGFNEELIKQIIDESFEYENE